MSHQCPGTTTTGRPCRREVTGTGTCGRCAGQAGTTGVATTAASDAMTVAADADPVHDQVIRHTHMGVPRLREIARDDLTELDVAAEDYFRMRAKAGDGRADRRLADHGRLSAARTAAITAMREPDVLDSFSDTMREDARTFRRRTAELAAAWEQADRDPAFLSDDLVHRPA